MGRGSRKRRDPRRMVCPVHFFDLDQDGVDEIWFVNNLNPNIPFSLNARVLERIDPLTGETTGVDMAG